jgi:hypothetical protein
MEGAEVLPDVVGDAVRVEAEYILQILNKLHPPDRRSDRKSRPLLGFSENQ